MTIRNTKDRLRYVRTQAPIDIDSHAVRHSVSFQMVKYFAIGNIASLSVIIELPYYYVLKSASPFTDGRLSNTNYPESNIGKFN